MNIFNSVKQTRVKKSLFDLTHDVKLSCKMGELIPILNMDCLPGDHVNISGEVLVRFAPMLAPMMHRVDVTIHYFFCPWRILWKNWEKFITGRALTPPGSAVPAIPTVDITTSGNLANANFQKLADYLGAVPGNWNTTPTQTSFQINAFPFAVYQRIWMEYYADENLTTSVDPLNPPLLDDGLNIISPVIGVLHKRCWEHDYFTAALPWAQKGPNVRVPMNDHYGTLGSTIFSKPDGTIPGVTGALQVDTGGGLYQQTSPTPTFQPLIVQAGTINELRKAYKLQEWLEKNARGGSRYKESILVHFGVNTSDKRLQRPEYITGLKTPVVITQVLNSTGTTTLPQGNMAGHGASITSGKAGSYFCEEHGTIMGIMSIMPKTAYQQGVAKQFLKRDYLDFGWPEFAHLGEQGIDYNEIYAYIYPNGENPFGYIPRYAEYKFMMNRVCGDFRTTLNYWHMGRIFSTPPLLNESFVTSNPTTRIFAVTANQDGTLDNMFVQVLNHIKALRPLPKYGNPGW